MKIRLSWLENTINKRNFHKRNRRLEIADYNEINDVAVWSTRLTLLSD